MSTLAGLLGARDDGDALVYRFGRELHGAFGGAFGGLVAAAALHAARRISRQRTPAGLDCRFVRPLPAGEARATPTVLHDGRSMTWARVDVVDGRGRLAATATVSFVDADRLHPLDRGGTAAPVPARTSAWSLPSGVDAPIMALLDPKLGGFEAGAIAADILVPWDDVEGHTSAEAACVAADLCVGPPVAAACDGTWLPHPNPDLSLRLAPVGAIGARITGIGRIARIAGGQAVVDIDVHASGLRYAAGAATSIVLRGEAP